MSSVSDGLNEIVESLDGIEDTLKKVEKNLDKSDRKKDRHKSAPLNTLGWQNANVIHHAGMVIKLPVKGG